MPFAEIFPKIQNDWSTGTNSIDVGVFAAGWGVELDAAGLLEDMDPYVAKDTKIDMADIAPYFREFGQKVGGKTKLLMVDGDFQMVYYRKDVLEKAGLQPPKTWEEYLDVASKIHGQDMNGDGRGGLRLLHLQEAQCPVLLRHPDFAAPIVQTQGTAQGFHFDNATMKPIINNEAWKKAFELYKETGKYGPPEELNMDIGDTRAIFKAGRCGLLIEWGDPGTLQLDRRCRRRQGQDLRRRRRWLEGSARPRHRQARAGDQGKCAALGRRHQLRALRRLRWLGRRDQRQGRSEEEGRGLCVPLLHEPGGPVERRRDDRRHGLQPLPQLAAAQHGSVGEGRHAEPNSPRTISARSTVP